VRRKAFGRALRVKAFLDASALSEYIEAHEQSVLTSAGSNPESAAEQVPGNRKRV
jgi:hypothetical protein